jgi:EpsI family protein
MQISKKIYWLIIALMVIMAIYVYRLQFAQELWPEGLRLESFPLKIGEWQGFEQEFKLDYYDESRLGKTVGTQHIMREYTDDKGNSLGLYVGYFNYRKGSEHHNPDTCFSAQGWQILNRKVVAFGGPPRKAISMQVTKGLDRKQLLFWFQIEGDTMVSKLRHQLYLVKQSLLHNRANGVVVRLTAPIADRTSQEKIISLQKEFAGEVFELLPEYLP